MTIRSASCIFFAVCFAVFFLRCTKNPANSDPIYIKPSHIYDLSVKEPSGLSMAVDGTFLWLVSDADNGIYKISFTGEMLRRLPYTGSDHEGIEQSPIDSTLWVVDEELARMTQVSIYGTKFLQYDVPIEGGQSSLEGIAVNSITGHFYLLKEKDPGLLIEMDETLEILKRTPLSFAKDYSDISYDAVTNSLWILSDQDQKYFRCSVEGNVRAEYKSGIIKAEGIAVDPTHRLLYIVSELAQKLYVIEY